MNSDPTVPRCKFVAGLNQTKKAIRSHACACVYLACDADEHFRMQVISLCQEYQTNIKTDMTMAQLGDMCGIDVNCAVCAQLACAQ